MYPTVSGSTDSVQGDSDVMSPAASTAAKVTGVTPPESWPMTTSSADCAAENRPIATSSLTARGGHAEPPREVVPRRSADERAPWPTPAPARAPRVADPETEAPCRSAGAMRARALREAAASDACAARGAAATHEPASIDIVARARGFKRSKLSTRRAFGCARATPVSKSISIHSPL